MPKRNAEKTVVLIYTAILILLFILPADLNSVGLNGSVWWTRLTYQHFHANIFHLIVNLWALLGITFEWNVSWIRLVIAFIVSATYPTPFISTMVVGISGWLYALMGLFCLQATNKVKFNSIILASILVGLLMPNMCVGIHLYCYAVGCFLAIVKNKLFK